MIQNIIFDWGNKSFLFYLTLYMALFIIPIFLYVYYVYHLIPFQYLLLDKNISSSVGKGLGIGVFVILIFLIVNHFSIHIDISRNGLFKLLGLLLAGPLEEIPFRGFYLKEFSAKIGFVYANLLSSLMFAALHFQSIQPEEFVKFIVLFILSLWLGYLYHKTKSLWPPIIVHSFYNLSTIIFT
jgi:membrane protease YdiL (CAAX protease family)